MQQGLASVVLSEMILKLTVAVVKQATLRPRNRSWPVIVKDVRAQCERLITEQVDNYASTLRVRYPDLPDAVVREEGEQVRTRLRACFNELADAHLT